MSVVLETSEVNGTAGALKRNPFAAGPPNGTRHRIFLGMPGPSAYFAAYYGMMNASDGRHEMRLINSPAAAGNFDGLWCAALNAFEHDEITHFAMLHSDVFPQDHGWLDVMLEEMDRLGVLLVSAPVAIKDLRGLGSAGVGNPDTPWAPLRRFTVREVLALPESFTAADAGYAGHALLHNNGCWVADLRDPRWREVDAAGNLLASFNFPRRCHREAANGRWTTDGESEDWYFSRRLHELGITSAITRRVRLAHRGTVDFPNWVPFGIYQNGDEDTAPMWRREATIGLVQQNGEQPCHS
jgi:hypothetical protein